MERVLDGRSISVSSLYGESTDDRLTLVTSGTWFPWNSGEAIVAIAVMKGKPFPALPQNGLGTTDRGNTGSTSAWPIAMLAMLALAAAIAAATYLYRRSSPVVAYLLTVPPMLVFAILGAEALATLMPAWA